MLKEVKTWLLIEDGETQSSHRFTGTVPPSRPGITAYELTKEQAIKPPTALEVADGKVQDYVPPPAPEPVETYADKRKREYREKLGDQGDQNDAIYKGVMGAISLLKEMGATEAQLEKYGLVPDKTADKGTPAYWLGTIADIKTRIPKPKELSK